MMQGDLAVLDIRPAPLDHARRVADEVARRYNVAVCPSVVSLVRQGAQAIDYSGAGAAALSWKAGRDASMRARVRQQKFARVADRDPAIVQRRDRVQALHALGKSDLDMAGAIGCSVGTIINDRAALGLDANRHVPSHVVAAQLRAQQALALIAAGSTVAQAARAVGVSERHLRRSLPRGALPKAAPPMRRQARRVVEMAQAGRPVGQIVSEMKIWRQKVLDILAEAGITPAPEPDRGPPSAYESERQRVEARRAQIAAHVAAGMGLVDVYFTVKPRAGAFRTDCLALGYGWPVAGLAKAISKARIARQTATRRAGGQGSRVSQRALREANVAQVAAMLDQGCSRSQICETLGISVTSVRSYAAELGRDLPTLHQSRKRAGVM